MGEFREAVNHICSMFGGLVKESVRESLEDIIVNEVANEVEYQRDKDIVKSLVILIENGCRENDKLYDILDRYWGIDSRWDATAYIDRAKEKSKLK